MCLKALTEGERCFLFFNLKKILHNFFHLVRLFYCCKSLLVSFLSTKARLSWAAIATLAVVVQIPKHNKHLEELSRDAISQDFSSCQLSRTFFKTRVGHWQLQQTNPSCSNGLMQLALWLAVWLGSLIIKPMVVDNWNYNVNLYDINLFHWNSHLLNLGNVKYDSTSEPFVEFLIAFILNII